MGGAGADSRNSDITKLNVCTAKSIAPLSLYPAEKEIILLPQCKYVVTENDWVQKKRWMA